MAPKAITTVPPAPLEEGAGLTKAKVLELPSNVVSFASKMGARAAAVIEEADADDNEPQNFVMTPEIHAEIALNSELDLDPIDDDEDEDEYDHGAVLEYDDDGNPVSVTGYLPGLTPHPEDVAPTMPVIGAGRKSEANATARQEMIDHAEKRGYARVLAHVLQFHHDGLVPESADMTDMNERRKQAARFLMGIFDTFNEQGIDPTDEELFQNVTDALVALFRSKWKLHVTDRAVDTIARSIADEDTTEDDIMASLILLGFCTEQWHFDELQKVAEFANQYGDDQRRRGSDTKVCAKQFADGVESIYMNGDELNISFDVFLSAIQQAESWDEMKLLVAIMKKPFEGFDPAKPVLTEKIKMNKFKVRLLNTLAELKQRDPKGFTKHLMRVFKRPTVNEAARKTVELLNKFSQ